MFRRSAIGLLFRQFWLYCVDSKSDAAGGARHRTVLGQSIRAVFLLGGAPLVMLRDGPESNRPRIKTAGANSLGAGRRIEKT
jgi:hypothetical protein